QSLLTVSGSEKGGNWEKEFQTVCSRTDDAMTLTDDQMRDFIARCDNLENRIGEVPGPGRKVFLRRLQMCRDLFVFTLATRQKE
ncbi:MAG TPA: hypothetical protein VMC85_00165, partial [Desulfomonilaceae bacterium]|nr:hypothetical protein [Desulfomonilaceae bacterium]